MGFFWTAKFQILLVMPDIPDFFIFFLGGGGGGGGGLNTVDAGSKPIFLYKHIQLQIFRGSGPTTPLTKILGPRMISYIANLACPVRQSSQFSQFMSLIFNELDRLPHVNMIQCKAFCIVEQQVLHAIRVYTIPAKNYLPWPK